MSQKWQNRHPMRMASSSAAQGVGGSIGSGLLLTTTCRPWAIGLDRKLRLIQNAQPCFVVEN
jgi:hypothetical protein